MKYSQILIFRRFKGEIYDTLNKYCINTVNKLKNMRIEEKQHENSMEEQKGNARATVEQRKNNRRVKEYKY